MPCGAVSQYVASQVLAISQLSNQEWIAVKATLHVVENPELICETCVVRYGPNIEAGKKFREVRGCETPVYPPAVTLENRIKFHRCVGNFTSETVLKWMEMSEQFGRGIMPFPGAMTEQPAKAMELFGMIESWRLQQRIKQANEQARASNAAARKGSRGKR